jgi:long-chain acyl-CoA synthetase
MSDRISRIRVTIIPFVNLAHILTEEFLCNSINHSHITVIFATVDHIPLLLNLAPSIPILKMIVSINDLSEESRPILTAWGESKGIQVKDFRESKLCL